MDLFTDTSELCLYKQVFNLFLPVYLVLYPGSHERIEDLERVQRPEEDLQILQVAEIIKHEQYNATTYDYDIALLRLKRQVEISTTVKTVCLPESGEEKSKLKKKKNIILTVHIQWTEVWILKAVKTM